MEMGMMMMEGGISLLFVFFLFFFSPSFFFFFSCLMVNESGREIMRRAKGKAGLPARFFSPLPFPFFFFPPFLLSTSYASRSG